ncbi:glutathione S-transferase family protein [Seongchinamella sediminis]|uniref:Glutathione S-transferase family protein n=1 Tax=Seongchinamella sediminis TaxID=2283635 RepID=A0A3L7E0D3_9GAMM|nr:glutathione S-transferase family protein [Seongchinamella sediminis]RLQ22375.1 glutathione S-transferase family protein [Seongchinamella sediminis]
MLTLHGFPYSNYYNIVKHALLYKDIPFREDLTYGGGEDWLQISPASKVPAITTENGDSLSETSVICDYLEEAYPDRPLYPEDPYRRAQVRQIMKMSELYLELSSRQLLPHVLGQRQAPEPLKEQVRQTLQRGIAALDHLCRFDPWVTGAEFSMADIYLRYVSGMVRTVGENQLQWYALSDIPAAANWEAAMAESPAAVKIDADKQANASEFFAYIRQRYGS